MRDPVVEAAALQRVVHVAGAVRGEHDDRRHLGAHDAELGHRDRPVGEDLEQERLELVVGAVDLVDQQHRRHRAVVRERAQQRALHEEPLRVELVLVDALVARLDRAQVQQLARVVPLVDRLRRVDALVALQPHAARRRSSAPAPWRPRSCRRRPRPRAAAAAAAAARGRSRSRARRRPGTRGRPGPWQTSATVSGSSGTTDARVPAPARLSSCPCMIS